MSQKVVRYEGDGRARRPVYEDLGPASGRIVGEFGEGKTALLTGTAVLPTRRTWDGRQTSDEIQASRMRGAARTSAIHAERRAAEEEPAVVDPVPDPEPDVVGFDVALDFLALRSEAARVAWYAKAAAADAAIVADAKWEEARELLERAWRDVQEGIRPGAGMDAALRDELVAVGLRAMDHRTAYEITDRLVNGTGGDAEPVDQTGADHAETIPEPVAGAEPAQEAGGGPGAVDTPRLERPGYDGLTTFQRRALEATIRSKGDRKAAAAALGVKFYQSIDGALEKAGEKGLLPIDLIPLLPARFAKYSGI